MRDMEDTLLTMNKAEQNKYIKQCYKQVLDEYTPVVKRMTRTQGKVLVKLIDRETEYTAYGVIKEFRGGFVASFWQGIGKIFGQDLKAQYDKEVEDWVLEQIVVYYEAGLLWFSPNILSIYIYYTSDVGSVVSPDFCRLAKIEALQLSIFSIRFLK